MRALVVAGQSDPGDCVGVLGTQIRLDSETLSTPVGFACLPYVADVVTVVSWSEGGDGYAPWNAEEVPITKWPATGVQRMLAAGMFSVGLAERFAGAMLRRSGR